MDFETLETKQLVQSYPNSVKQLFEKYSQHYLTSNLREDGTTLVSRLDFEKFLSAHPELNGRCKFFIAFGNQNLKDSSNFYPCVIDLNYKYWFLDLCSALGNAPDVLTLGMKSIKGFSRDDMVENGLQFWTPITKKVDKITIPLKFDEDFDQHLQKWWSSVIETQFQDVLKALVKQFTQKTISNYFNKGEFEVEFNEITKRALLDPVKLKPFGGGGSPESILASTSCILEYLYQKVGLNLKFLVVASKGMFKQYIAHINDYHAKNYAPIDITEREIASFVDYLIRPVFAKVVILDSSTKKDISEILNGKCSKIDQDFKQLQKTHLTPLRTSIKKARVIYDEYHDPLHKELDNIITPYYHYIHSNSTNIHPKDFKRMINPHSITPNWKTLSLPREVSQKDIVLIGNTTHPKSNIELIYDAKDDTHLLQLVGNTSYDMVSPFTSKIKDHNEKWHSFVEYYDPEKNISVIKL
jgi:hypothetical protein